MERCGLRGREDQKQKNAIGGNDIIAAARMFCRYCKEMNEFAARMTFIVQLLGLFRV